MVGIYNNTLRIFAVDKLGEMFNQVDMPLQYTAREMNYDLGLRKIITIETDHLTYPSETRAVIKDQIFQATEDEEYKEVSEQQVGYPKAAPGNWASCIRVIDPVGPKTHELLELSENEAAFSMLVTDKLGTGDRTY